MKFNFNRSLLALLGVVGLLAAGLMAYAEYAAFSWDDGFHLLTAQLIRAGKRPYLDFCFPQTPLNAYWNAAWMGVFGESWRTPHAVATVVTAMAILLVGEFLLARFPVPRWRMAAALAAVFTMGLNEILVYWSSLQAYGLCLLLIVAAFRMAIAAVEREGFAAAGAAGLLSGAAAASSLLTAPVAPVLFIWILIYNRAGKKLAKAGAFAGGALLALQPLLWLFARGPRRTFFDVIEYNLLHRQEHWANAMRHDLGVLASWIDSSQALVTGLLACAGLLFVVFRSGWGRAVRAEYTLCAWLAVALTVHISSAHPMFPQYFILPLPFFAILAAVGLYSVGSRMLAPDRPFWPVFTLVFLLSFALGKSLTEELDDFSWEEFEEIAAQVQRVTPPGASLLANEQVYFLTRRTPPPGMEHNDSHKLELPPALARLVHIVNGSELDRRVRAGEFDTLETCDEDDKIRARGLAQVYAHQVEVDTCTVFWGPRR